MTASNITVSGLDPDSIPRDNVLTNVPDGYPTNTTMPYTPLYDGDTDFFCRCPCHHPHSNMVHCVPCCYPGRKTRSPEMEAYEANKEDPPNDEA